MNKEKIARSFKEHWEQERWDRYFDKNSPQYQQSERAWQAAKLLSAAELAAKDKEIAELKKKTGFKTGFFVNECNNCGHNWSSED